MRHASGSGNSNAMGVFLEESETNQEVKLILSGDISQALRRDEHKFYARMILIIAKTSWRDSF